MKGYAYAELLRNLIGRDLKLRYRGTVLGFFWSLIQPAVMFMVYYAVFSLLARGFGDRNYPLLLIVGLFTFTFFSSGVSKATPSVVQAGGLIRQVAFPRVILPLATVAAEALHFLVMVAILIIASLADWVAIQGQLLDLLPLLALPVVLAAHFALTLGLGLIFSTLNVFYRDTGQVVNTLMTIWFFATPVFYAPPNVEKFLSLPFATPEIAPWLHRLYYLNPMAHVVKGYRDILYDHRWPELGPLLTSLLWAGAALAIGLAVFRRHQHRFAEEV